MYLIHCSSEDNLACNYSFLCIHYFKSMNGGSGAVAVTKNEALMSYMVSFL